MEGCIEQKLLDSKVGPVTKNLNFNITKEINSIKKTMVELDASITAFCGLNTDPMYRSVLNRMSFLNHRVKRFKVPDKPEEIKLRYSDLKDHFLAKYYSLKVKLNTKLRPTLREQHQKISSNFNDIFKYIKCLGEGGFGDIFEVEHKYDGCRYAVKRVKYPPNKRSRKKVKREVKVLANLKHENIVRYYSCWVQGPIMGWKKEGDENLKPSSSTLTLSSEVALPAEKPKLYSKSNNRTKKPPAFLYILMELCEKANLRKWLREKDRNRGDEMIIFMQILNAVIYLHSKDLIHRNLKPGNIFFALDGTIKVGDFGLVLDVGSSSSTEGNSNASRKGHTKWFGTELYMSPELNSGSYNHKVDIYALGIILFELFVYFSTEMERNKVLTDLRAQKYPEGFAEKYPLEFLLLQNMLRGNPDERSTATEIKDKILSVLDENDTFKLSESDQPLKKSDNGEETDDGFY